MRFHADGADKVVLTAEIGIKRLETGVCRRGVFRLDGRRAVHFHISRL